MSGVPKLENSYKWGRMNKAVPMWLLISPHRVFKKKLSSLSDWPGNSLKVKGYGVAPFSLDIGPTQEVLLIHKPHSRLVFCPPPCLTVPILYRGTICLHSSPTQEWSCCWCRSQDCGNRHWCQTTQVLGGTESHQGDSGKTLWGWYASEGITILSQFKEIGAKWWTLFPKCVHHINRDINKCYISHHSLKTFHKFSLWTIRLQAFFF